MFEIRNVATGGFDRAIIAMRRENGGREASDSEWIADVDDGLCLFEIGPNDKAECECFLKAGDYEFMKYITVWAHIEAPAEWWAVYGGYFIAQSNVERDGKNVTRSVMTTYANFRNLIDAAYEVATDRSTDWRAWVALRDMARELPESWLLVSKMGV